MPNLKTQCAKALQAITSAVWGKRLLHLQYLEAAKERRKSHRVSWPQLIIDEREQRPFHASGDHYRKIFKVVRDEAAKTMPSCATLRDQDLRDTNQTWLDRASVEDDVMAMIAGHAAGGAKTMQRKHYVAENQQRADAAIEALNSYMERTGHEH